MDIKSLWNFADPAASEALFRERLAGASRDDALNLQTQIARSLGLRSQFDAAHALLDTLEPQLANAGPERQLETAHEADGYVFEEIAENRLAQGEAAAARPYFARAHALLSADTSLDRPDAEHLARLLRSSR